MLVEVYVVNSESYEIKEGSPYSTKRGRQTTMFLDPTTRIPIYAPLNPPAGRRINIYPGQIDAEKKGLQLDIVKKEGGKLYCWVHDPELYVSSNKEKWKINKGRYYIIIRIRYAGGYSEPACFLLINESEDPGNVMLKKCSKNEEKNVLNALRRQGYLK